MKLDKNTLHNYWIENEEKFKSIVDSMTFRPCGVWYTDAFLFLSICDLLDVDLIIESGRAWGVSTEIFAKYFKNIEIHSFERVPERAEIEAQKHLSKLDNVHCYNMNVFDNSRLIVQDNFDKNIGVFIDGPKDHEAQQNLTKHLDYTNVKTFGYHDVKDYSKEDFHTYNLDFIQDFMYLNDKIFIEDPAQLDNGESGAGCLVKIN